MFVDTSAVILQKNSEIVEEIFFQLWKCNLVDFIKISGINVEMQTFTDED